ncbi:carbohydrate ABC transporter permease [Streptomyces collinus]|uniref:Multiple sugar transport system permease protein n=2 Tax=Streptomyces TaxID=1883 RepID=A0AA89PVD6_STRCU|nr:MULTISPECIES: sugar ABC transporter permease [Streptomyces]MBB5809313.1 multiple sugar transport system permease protein [Streptomyces collinus]MEC7052288.1 sugar ABC transporter permease [Streptomyces violaceochromogenes]WMX62670.1 sugar ABC transporter permease [Streptomyces collinus]GHC80915.1 sugar ABC transporter permease [Streptomyces violaceochromogenes]
MTATATTPGPRRARIIGKKAVLPWLFLAPGLLLALVFKFLPMGKGVWLSFFDVRPFLGDKWVGLDNYTRVLTDHRFQDAIGHTLLLGVGMSLGGIVVGSALALLLEGQARSLKIIRTAVFLPVVTATAVVGEMWRLMYYPTSDGLLNSGLGLLGLGPVPYLDNPDTALWATMAMGIWMLAPYNMVIILAGLAGVDRSLYEAAAMDGVSLRQRLRHITLPAIRPALGIVLTLAAIRGLRVFTEVYVLTGGGPAGSTDVWMTRAYTLGFTRNDIGGASAASVVLLCVTLLLTVTVNYLRKRGDVR